MMIPGRTLHRLAAHICSTHTLEQIVEPAIADFQKEYATADKSVRGLALIRGYAAILKVMAICALRVPFTNGRGFDRDQVALTVVWSLVLISGVTAVSRMIASVALDRCLRAARTATSSAATITPPAASRITPRPT